MKCIKSILLIAFCTINTLCAQEFSLNGIIENGESKPISIQFRPTVISINDSIISKGRTDAKGSFSLTGKLKKPMFCYLHYGDEITGLYLSPGDKLTLKTKMEMFDEALAYTGNSAEINNLIALGHLKFRETDRKLNKQFREALKDTTGLEKKYYWTLLDSIATEKTKYYSKFSKHTIMYKVNMHTLLMGMRMHLYSSYDNELPDFTAFENYTQTFLKKHNYKLYDEKKLEKSEYVNMLLMWFQAKQDALYLPKEEYYDAHKSEYFTAYFKLLEEIPSQKIPEVIKASFINSNLYSTVDVKNIKPYVDTFLKQYAGSVYAKIVQEEVTTVLSVNEGKSAPAFSLIGSDGETHSLKDLKGKYVLLDIWATWCGPCVREIPHLKTLYDGYKGKNIEFISVSIDPEESTWRNFLAKKEMPWKQLRDPGNFEAPIIKDYNVSGIPHFVLIDRQGVIIDVNSYRPSHDLKEIIDALPGL